MALEAPLKPEIHIGRTLEDPKFLSSLAILKGLERQKRHCKDLEGRGVIYLKWWKSDHNLKNKNTLVIIELLPMT
jgi:hypothetical protein